MAEYIEREELMMAMASVCSDPTCPMHIATEIEQIVDCAPTIDVAPVVHGRLVREVREVTDAVSVKGWACSVCGGFVKNQPVDRWRQCPFCGALFDGGDLDGQKV